MQHPFNLYLPENWQSAAIFSVPHSGRDYSDAFLRESCLSAHDIRSSEDAYADELVESAPLNGAPLLVATAPRAFVDLNRGADELDSAIVQGAVTNKHNPRVASGLGVIPRVVAEGRAIQRGKIDMATAQLRLQQNYHPYHDQLSALLEQTRSRFGTAILFDCHSMPHDALANMVVRGQRKPDIVLGDRFGASASKAVMDQVEAAFVAQGFAVARNMPFAGAFITRTYGRPANNQHAIQIEIDRGLYLDERKIEKSAGFADVQQRMAQVITRLVQIGADDIRIAAE